MSGLFRHPKTCIELICSLMVLACPAQSRAEGAAPDANSTAPSPPTSTPPDAKSTAPSPPTSTPPDAKSTAPSPPASTPPDANSAKAPPRGSNGTAPKPSTLNVVVQGQVHHPSEASRDRGVATTVIGRRELRKPGVELGDVLRGEPGVKVTDFGGVGAVVTASLRGATAQQTPVYLGGIRLNDEVGGVADLGLVPVWFLDRIEVYRSMGPVDADLVGIGGAIYLEPHRACKSEFGLGTVFGSYGTRGVWAYSGQRGEHGGALAALRVQHADNDYKYNDGRGTLFVKGDDREGRLPNADVTSQDLWLAMDRDLGHAKVALLANLVDREQGAIKLAAVPSQSARVAFHRGLLGVTGTSELSRSMKLDLAAEGISTHQDIDDPAHELGLRVAHVKLEGRRIDQRASLRADLPGNSALSVMGGIALDRLQRYESEAAEGLDDPVLSATRFSNYLRSGLDLGLGQTVHLRSMVGVDCRTTGTGAVTSGCGDAYVPWRLGTFIEFGEQAIYGSVGQAQRVPTLAELYGVSLLVQGNPQLLPESAINAELGWRYSGKRAGARRPLWLDAAAFSRFIEHVVTFVRSSEGHLKPINRDRGRFLGAELAGGIGITSAIEVRGAVTLLDPRDTSPNRPYGNDILPYRSRLFGYAALDAKLPWESADLGPLLLETRLTHESSRFSDPAGLEVIPAQSSLDFGLRAEALARRIAAHLRVSNVLDAQRFDVVGFPLPRRSAFLTMEAKW